jgi:hypothetical protein
MGARVTDVDSMSDAELISLAYRAGNLRFKVQPHQLDFYDRFRAWNVERQTKRYLQRMRDLAAQFDNMWVNRWSRRVGKTCCTLLLGYEESARYFNRTGKGAQGMIAIPVQKKIGGVLVPLTRELFADAPDGYFPEHRSSGQGLHEHLYVPAFEARMILVGTDDHPRALAGTYLDWFAYTEASFAKPGLYSDYVSVIKDQFQGRPWAWSLFESSEPEVFGHDFNLRFVPDAKARGAYYSMQITDNTSLTDEQIQDEIRRSGGRNSPECMRELFNEVAPDLETMICPEFDEAIHVVDPADWPMPTHALAYTGMDPGVTDPFGLVNFYFDFMRQCIVVQSAWQKANASTLEVVTRNRDTERELWGTQHRLPGETDVPMQSLANALQVPGGHVWEEPEGALSYWDESSWSLKPNPFSRISDVANRFVLDLNNDYAMAIRKADKQPGSAEADMQYLRMLFAARPVKVVILRNGRTDMLIRQLRDGRIKRLDDGKMVDWLRSKETGHCDTVAAFKYAARDVAWNRNPFPPALKDVHADNMQVPAHYKDRAKNAGVMPALFQPGRRGIESFGERGRMR